MSTEQIKQTYRDVEIIYIERDDKWNFTVNGRERNLESLAKAKESIDRALDKEVKERPWKPFEAWYEERFGSREYQKARVTSEADRDYGQRQFWISREIKPKYAGDKDHKREKVGMDYLFAATPENDEKIGQIISLREQAEKLYAEASALKSELAPIQPGINESE